MELGAGWACWARAAGERERAWPVGRAGRAGERASGRGRTRRRAGARAGERQLGARQGAGRAAGRRWARAAWAPGLVLGSALGALGPFSIRFDSFFFLSHQMNIVHYKIKFFRKKK